MVLSGMDQTPQYHNLKSYVYIRLIVEKLLKWITRSWLTKHEIKLPEQLGSGYIRTLITLYTVDGRQNNVFN